MKYDFIIVLCPEKKIGNVFPEFSNGMYLGGQTRMDAAIELFKNNKETNFVVVGGYDPTDNNNKVNEKSKKVDDMESFLREKCPDIKLVGVKSLPCTMHNLVAVFNTWINKDKINLENKNIGILTNFYHLPRTLRFALKAKMKISPNNISDFIPICAESLANLQDNNMYTRNTEYLLRLESERKGLRDLESDSYKDDCLDKKITQFIGIASKYSDILLTLDERKEFEKRLQNK